MRSPGFFRDAVHRGERIPQRIRIHPERRVFEERLGEHQKFIRLLVVSADGREMPRAGLTETLAGEIDDEQLVRVLQRRLRHLPESSKISINWDTLKPHSRCSNHIDRNFNSH